LPIAGSMQPPPGYEEMPTEMRLYRLFKQSESMVLGTEPTAFKPGRGSVPSPRRKLD